VSVFGPGHPILYLDWRVEAAGESTNAESAFTIGNGRPAPVCPDFHAAIELIGRRWAGAILWSLAERPHYFAELTASVPGLSDRLLSRRLRELEKAGLVERSVRDGSPARVSYALTEKGRSLQPALAELTDWARAWKLSS
jgi:DNA-binding HxlR family transcriptional regulator